MMNSTRSVAALSLRLNALKSYYANHKHIWDIGCDHGLLGLSFHQADVDSINLIDPSVPVIELLQKRVKDSYITKGTLNIQCKKGQELSIDSKDNCIFIAGMGGKEIGEILINLIPQMEDTSRIVISPHRKILELRKLLNDLPIRLIDEQVVYEEGQFYQILCLTTDARYPRVDLYGDKLWSSEVGQEYLELQLIAFSNHQNLASKDYIGYLQTRKVLK